MKPYPNEELDRMSKREIIRLYKRTVEQFGDAVPVIRCKDCKYAEHEDDGDIMCTFWDFCECNHHVLGNGYCDRAERKEE